MTARCYCYVFIGNYDFTSSKIITCYFKWRNVTTDSLCVGLRTLRFQRHRGIIKARNDFNFNFNLDVSRRMSVTGPEWALIFSGFDLWVPALWYKINDFWSVLSAQWAQWQWCPAVHDIEEGSPARLPTLLSATRRPLSTGILDTSRTKWKLVRITTIFL